MCVWQRTMKNHALWKTKPGTKQRTLKFFKVRNESTPTFFYYRDSTWKKIFIYYKFWNWFSNLLIVWLLTLVLVNLFLVSENGDGVGKKLKLSNYLTDYRKNVLYPYISFQSIVYSATLSKRIRTEKETRFVVNYVPLYRDIKKRASQTTISPMVC